MTRRPRNNLFAFRRRFSLKRAPRFLETEIRDRIAAWGDEAAIQESFESGRFTRRNAWPFHDANCRP